MKVLIVDDEADARQNLERKLGIYTGRVSKIDHAAGVSEGLTMLQEHEYDLLFLDIRMPDGTGFDLLGKLPELSSMVVFCTAYDEFAIKAFEFAAMGYLMKPIDEKQLDIVMNRAEEKYQTISGQYKLLVESYREKKVRKIVIPNSAGFQISEISDILYLQSDGNYSVFHFVGQEPKLVSSKTLKEYEGILNLEGFFRIHQSYLINLTHVRKYNRTYNEAIMTDGTALPVARQKRSSFQNAFI